MQLIFDSIEEVKEFVSKLKGTRGGKADKEDDAATDTKAPPPIQPPQNAQPGAQGFPGGATGFAPPAGGATAAGPFAQSAPVVDPAVQGLVTRIIARIDGAVGGGQPVETVTQWFRTQCGAEAATADLNQIKAAFLPKMAVAQLEGIAKLMNA